MSGTGDALVGWTGFVGGNLSRQHDFAHRYASATAPEMAGHRFDRVVFSAARAEKWRINQDPVTDRAHIEDLKRILSSFRAERLVLVSTVDVYAKPVGVDETTPLPAPGLHPYGAHRFELEEFARSRFDNVLVVRLPGLFGPGIKKNVIFDLLTGNNLSAIDHRGSFQYYDLRRLWADIGVALDAGFPLVNFATEPVTTGKVAQECFDLDFRNEPPGSSPGTYDVRSVHADAFGGHGGYLQSADQVLADLRSFVLDERSR
ncbi:NAD-dependent epimerase/dehydratase family protein [Angustibacter luteus]|uniref:NAD-dependent epimerase/dehydratase family protein n=1 Tax=Angustibacter luteus TaxID=658456 RepID=A0ABW1JA83_9ACTN